MAASQPGCPQDEPLLTAAELGRVPDTPAEGAPAARTDHTQSDVTGTLTIYPRTGALSLSGVLCPSLSLSPGRTIRIPVPIPCTLWLSNLAIGWVRHCLLPPLDGNAVRGLVCRSLSAAEEQCPRPGRTPHASLHTLLPSSTYPGNTSSASSCWPHSPATHRWGSSSLWPQGQ